MMHPHVDTQVGYRRAWVGPNMQRAVKTHHANAATNDLGHLARFSFALYGW